MSLRKYTVLSITLFLLTFIVTAMLRSQGMNNAVAQRQQASDDENQSSDYYPSAEYSAELPTDPEKRAKRELRNKRGNLRDKNLKPEDVAGFSIASRYSKDVKPLPRNNRRDEKAQSSSTTRNAQEEEQEMLPPVLGAVSDHSPDAQPLPTDESDAIISGEVTNAQAFLSEDKTSAYSEFETRVGEILKNSDSVLLASGESVDVLRGGGRVRLPSGEVKNLGGGGWGAPRVGRRYVFFLKYDKPSQSYYIITGYELRDGKVFPLDGIPRYASENHQYRTYNKYKGVDEGKFFSDLRQAIINPPSSMPSKYPIGNPSSKENTDA